MKKRGKLNKTMAKSKKPSKPETDWQLRVEEEIKEVEAPSFCF